MKAIYAIYLKSIGVLIPKRKGTGYCKSVFGFHSSNKQSQLFDDIKPEWFAGDTCDIDGYLDIEIRIPNDWANNKEYKEGLSLTIDALKQCFPFVTEFQEISVDEFTDYVLRKK